MEKKNKKNEIMKKMVLLFTKASLGCNQGR